MGYPGYHIVQQVEHGLDDAYCAEVMPDFYWHPTDPDVWLGPADSMRAYVRFVDIAVPQGVVVLSAYVKVCAYGDSNGDSGNSILWAENADDATRISSCEDLWNRVLTEQAEGGGEDWLADQWYDLAQISGAIQVVIDRPGWQHYNAINILGTQSIALQPFWAYDGDPDRAAILIIDWLYPGWDPDNDGNGDPGSGYVWCDWISLPDYVVAKSAGTGAVNGTYNWYGWSTGNTPIWKLNGAEYYIGCWSSQYGWTIEDQADGQGTKYYALAGTPLYFAGEYQMTIPPSFVGASPAPTLSTPSVIGDWAAWHYDGDDDGDGGWELPNNEWQVCDYTMIDGQWYRCIKAHSSTVDNRPITGVDWEEYWIAVGRPAARPGIKVPGKNPVYAWGM